MSPPPSRDESEKAVMPRNTSSGATWHAACPGFEASHTNCIRERKNDWGDAGLKWLEDRVMYLRSQMWLLRHSKRGGQPGVQCIYSSMQHMRRLFCASSDGMPGAIHGEREG